jgi:hypothetical protein
MSASREKRLRKESKAHGPEQTAKQKQQKQDAFRRTVAIIIAAAVVLGLVILIVYTSGILSAHLNVLTIGDVKISGAEFDYYYFSSFYETYEFYAQYGWLEMIGLDPARSLHRQDSGDGETTWAQYFEEMAVERLKLVVAQSEAARSEGIALAEEDLERLGTAMENLEIYAEMNGVKPDRFLKDNYGRGMSVSRYRAIFERELLSSRYVTTTTKAFDFSDSDMEVFYTANRENYDFIDYHAFSLSDRERADEMLARVTDAEAFWALSREFAEAEEDGHEHDEFCNHDDDSQEDGDIPEIDATFVEKRAVSALSGAAADFLSAESRRQGDKTVVEDEDTFTVLLFVSRYRDEGPYTEEGVKAEAERIYAEWLDGDADEDSFADFARRYSADGNSEQGGIYEGVFEGQMVETFNDWCFDPARRPGDSGIVETQFGQHIMFFVGINEEDGDAIDIRHILIQMSGWKADVKSAMETERLAEIREALLEAQGEHTRHWFGMLFTKYMRFE